MKKRWHALYVNSRAEKKVAELLTAKGIEAYVPLQKIMKQWSDRKKMVEVPLLNGYVFVNIDPSGVEKSLQTRCVVNFVKNNGTIGIVQDVEIARLKQLIELGYVIEVNRTATAYKEGDKIRITSGPLKSIEGYVMENKEGRFVDVLLEGIGQSIRVKLPEGILIPVK